MTASEILSLLLDVEGMTPPEPTPLLTDEPKLPVYIARMKEQAWGQGAHPDSVVAQLKAAGEALERYCLLTPDEDHSIQARYGELAGQVDPADFYCYSRSQTEDYDVLIAELRGAVFHWTPVRNEASGLPAYVPRELVYLDAVNYEARRIRRESLSSGAAVGVAGTHEAFGRALFELIERDAFMKVWLRGECPRRISGFHGPTAELIHLLGRYRLDVRLFDIRSEYGVPAVFALTLDSSSIGPAVTAGIAAAETYASAAEAALLESICYRRQVRLKQMSGELPPVENSADIDSVETRIAYWSDPRRLTDLPRWTEAAPTVDLRDLGAACTAQQALQRLANRGCRVMSAEITAPAAAAQGFEAVRVIIPEIHPLYLSEAAKSLYSRHLGEIAAADEAPPHPFA